MIQHHDACGQYTTNGGGTYINKIDIMMSQKVKVLVRTKFHGRMMVPCVGKLYIVGEYLESPFPASAYKRQGWTASSLHSSPQGVKQNRLISPTSALYQTHLLNVNVTPYTLHSAISLSHASAFWHSNTFEWLPFLKGLRTRNPISALTIQIENIERKQRSLLNNVNDGRADLVASMIHPSHPIDRMVRSN